MSEYALIVIACFVGFGVGVFKSPVEVTVEFCDVPAKQTPTDNRSEQE